MEVLPDTHFLILDHAVCFGQTLLISISHPCRPTMRSNRWKKGDLFFPWVLSVLSVWGIPRPSSQFSDPPCSSYRCASMCSILIIHHALSAVSTITMTIFLPIEWNVQTRAPFRLTTKWKPRQVNVTMPITCGSRGRQWAVSCALVPWIAVNPTDSVIPAGYP